MKVRLVWIESDRRGTELSRREEILQGESDKAANGESARRLIVHYYPELVPLYAKGLIRNPSRTNWRWLVRMTRLGPNRWLTVYADPVD